jgi:hypothetical protein
VIGIGDASGGLCGGMALTARDLWAAGVPAPPDAEPPANGTRRFTALVRRQVQSLDWLRVPLRYAVLAVLHPDPPTRLGKVLGREPVRVPSLLREWPRIAAELDAGRPCLVELIRVGGPTPAALVRNHQVLAWAYRAAPASADCADPADFARGGGVIALRVYDPNHPGRDDISLEVAVAVDDGRPLRERIALRQSTGEPLIGYFRGPDLRDEPVTAWR